jgi:mRNA interferase RelE/StbE
MYEVEFRPRAAREFENLDKETAARITRRLRWLADNFDSIRAEPLAGPLSGLFKLRVGDYRIIYRPDRDKRIIIVFMVGHRREIYNLPL